MKKLAALALASSTFLAKATLALAAVDVQVSPPQNIGVTANTSTVLSSAFTIIFVVAAIAVLFMLIIGAFQWITSGGEKEAVGHARGRITHALIGLAILALSFVIIRVVGEIVNINIFNLTTIPSLNGN